MDTTVVNFLGGPGVGKSTRMHQLVAHLKPTTVSVESAPEYAKEKVWEEEDPNLLNNQVHVFGMQQNRIHRLLGEVDVVVTDAPLLHSIVYDEHYDFAGPSEAFHRLVYDQFSRLSNVNVFIQRDVELYKDNGRYQNLEEAQAVDETLQDVLTEYAVSYTPLEMDASASRMIEVLTDLLDMDLD